MRRRLRVLSLTVVPAVLVFTGLVTATAGAVVAPPGDAGPAGEAVDAEDRVERIPLRGNPDLGGQ